MARKTIRILGFAAVLPAMALLLPTTVTAQDAAFRNRPSQYNQDRYASPSVDATFHANPAEYDTPQKNIDRLDWLLHTAAKRTAAIDTALNVFVTRLGNGNGWASGDDYGHGAAHGRGFRKGPNRRLVDDISKQSTDLGYLMDKSLNRVHALEGQVNGMDRTIVDLEKCVYDLKCERDRLLEENRRLRSQIDGRPRYTTNRRSGSVGGWRFNWSD